MRLSRLLAVSMFVVFALSSAAPFAATAASTAANACFCYVDDKGATKTDGATDDASCATLCAKNGTSDAGHIWAKSFGQYPGANLRCWEKQEDCEKDLDGDTSGPEGATIDGQWSYAQPAECLEGSHYCYSADTIKTYLQVEIAGTKSVVNFADYVGVVYQYLMGFSMTVAIVLLMIGGLRYVIGAGSGDITKAKKMMTNAVEGFVLLMFAYVILYTVNPQLLKLQVPKLPMLRQVTIVSGNDCATLLGLPAGATPAEINSKRDFVTDTSLYGEYAVVSTENQAVVKFEDSASRGNPRCGVDAEVMAGPGGSAVAEGTTCHFNYCDDAAKGCATVKDKAECVACNEVGPANTKGIVPSAALCSSLDPKTDTVEKKEGVAAVGTYNMCGYTNNPSLTTSNTTVVKAAALSTVAGAVTSSFGGIGGALVAAGYATQAVGDGKIGTCAYLEISCTPGFTCADYNKQIAVGEVAQNELIDLEPTLLGFPLGKPNAQSVCADDPCGVGNCGYYTAETGSAGCQSVTEMQKLQADADAEAARMAAEQEQTARCFQLLDQATDTTLTESERSGALAEYKANCE